MGVEGVGLRGDGGWVEFEVEGGGGEGEVGLEGHFFFFIFWFWVSFLLFCFLGGSVGGFGSIGLCICKDENGDYGSVVVVVVVVGNRCPRING